MTSELVEGATGLGSGAIVAAAVGIVARDGLGGLNMRRLAAELGVTAPALYRYFPDKRVLVKAVVTLVLSTLDTTWSTGYERVTTIAGWIDTTRQVAWASRELYLRHPGVAGFLLVEGPPTAAAAGIQAEVAALVRLGLPEARATEVYRAGAFWCSPRSTPRA